MSALDLSVAVSEINQLHIEICDAARTSIQKAVRIGELLTEQKASLKHGEWLPWLKVNVGFSRQTADNYRRIYERRYDPKLLSVGNLNEAYQLLSNSSEDEYDFDAVWEQIEFGMWKLERAWSAWIELEQRGGDQKGNIDQLISVIRQGQKWEAVAREYALRCEVNLGDALIAMERIQGG
jgi:hypothetical protein